MKTERTDIDVRQMMKKRVKGLVGILLAAVMLFAAVPAQNVQAAEYMYSYKTGHSTGFETWCQTDVSNLAESESIVNAVQAGDVICVYTSGSTTIITIHYTWDRPDDNISTDSDLYTNTIPADYPSYTLTFKRRSPGVAEVFLTPIIAAPVQEEEPSDTHQHDMQWTVLKKPTLTENGKEGYRCTICGYVDESASGSGTRTKSVSAYRYFGESVIKRLKEAQPGETILIDALVWKSCYKDVYEAIAARPDVTVTFRFAFDGYIFDTTIPAGADVLSLLNEEGYIGFLKLAEVYGAVMVSEE